MRIGVFGKVLLALGVLLLAFAGNATFTLLSIDRARQGVVANEAYLELQGSVDASWKALNDFVPGLGRGATTRLDPNLPLALRMGRKHLDDGLAAIDRYLVKEPHSSRRADFESKRHQLSTLAGQLEALSTRLGAAAMATDPRARGEFESHYATLTHSLNRLRRPLRGESGLVAQRLSDDEETALSMAIVLGAAGLTVAGAAFLFTLRTLRPLGLLRTRVRQLAGGDFAQRTGVTSQDEIGDLAREFDGMADAIQERERRLILSERLATVGRMAAQIAHEVRNPLSSIGLNAELLGDEIGPGSEEARRLVGSIISEVDRLTEITETYLRFARLPQPKLDREEVGVIVSSVVSLARGELAQAGIALEVDVPADLPEVEADEGQLRQALINLVRNAREAMAGASGPKRLAISAVAGDGDVAIRVRDSGPGIASADLAKIFDPFFSTKRQGTGLGLSLVQQIAVDHGGQIHVESAPGQGTTFTLTLRPASSSSSSSSSSGAGLHPVGVGATPVAEAVVETGERQVERGRILGAEEQGALEGGGAGGPLARRGEGAA